jgi:hypothetical protein
MEHRRTQAELNEWYREIAAARWSDFLAVVAPALAGVAPMENGQGLLGGLARPRYVFTDREAVLMMTPEFVAGPTTVRATWSPDSRFVLAYRVYLRELPPPSPQRLTVPPDDRTAPTQLGYGRIFPPKDRRPRRLRER